MNKVSIFSTAKVEMGHLVSQMTLENYPSVQDQLQRYLSFVDALNNLPDLEAANTDAHNVSEQVPEVHSTEKSQVAVESESIECLENIESLPERVYILNRDTVHGELTAPNREPIPIPEKFIRKCGFENGDLIQAVLSENQPKDGKTFYEYTLFSSENREPLETRIEYKYAFVERIFGRYYVTKYLDESEYTLVEFDQSERFEVWDTDIEKHKLTDGDCVTVAHWELEPESCRVTWKHDMDNPFSSPISMTKNKKPSKKHQKMTTEERRAKYNFPNLQGKKVVIVNGVIRQEYKTVLNFIGAECELLTGDEPYGTMESVMRSADVVVGVLTRGSHDASWTTAEFCKSYGVPFHFTMKGGLTNVMRCASEELTKRMTLASA